MGYAERCEHLASTGHSTDYAGSGMSMRHFTEADERNTDRVAKNQFGVRMDIPDDYDDDEPFIRVICNRRKCDNEPNIDETDRNGYCPDCADAHEAELKRIREVWRELFWRMRWYMHVAGVNRREAINYVEDHNPAGAVILRKLFDP